jgi:LppX_LprAFG lipoprotein
VIKLRARRAAWVTMLLLALLCFSGCGGSSAPATATLLKDAHDKFNATQSFHFVMTVQHPGTVQAGSYSITGANGDVQLPGRMKATATVNAGFANVQLQLIIIGNQEWYTDPLTGQFVSTNLFSSYMRIFDPQTGIGSLLTGLTNPSHPSDGSSNGTACWKVSGDITMAQLSPIFGSQVVGDAKDTTFCIRKTDSQLLSVVLQGQVLAGDSSQTIRTIYLSSFNKPVSIQAPST